MSVNNSSHDTDDGKKEIKLGKVLANICRIICFPCFRLLDGDRHEQKDVEKMLPNTFQKSDSAEASTSDATVVQTPMTLVAYAELARNCQKRTSGMVCEEN